MTTEVNHMYLSWGFEEREYEAFRGHVEPDLAIECLREEGIVEEEAQKGKTTIIHKHCWGRWSMITDDDGNRGHTLATYDSPGRGRFPITLLTFGKEVD
jgi:hypothetical protein